MATVHLLCGLPASGKTTVARRLEAEYAAVRFTLDEWMFALYDLGPYDDAYGPQADRVKELIWRTAERVVALQHDVVLDWSQWSRSARKTRGSADPVLELDARCRPPRQAPAHRVGCCSGRRRPAAVGGRGTP